MKRRERLFRTLLALFCAGASLLAVLLALVVVDTLPPRPGRDTAVRFERRGDYWVAKHSHMIRQPFLVEKPKDVFRVFVLGGSQAMGAPYASHDLAVISYAAGLLKVPSEGGLPTWLKYYLEPLFPGKRVEVVNACVYAHDLRAGVENLEWIVEHGRPDLVVIMGGDNEREEGRNHFRSYVEQASRRAYDELLARLTRGYAEGLDRAVALAESRRVPLYVLTVADNLRDWLPVDETDFDASLVDRMVVKDCAAAVPVLEKGGPKNALRLFYRAKCAESAGDSKRARALYVAAKDNDKAFIRARSAWNELIRERVRGRYARSLDVERFVAATVPGGSPGFDVFWDYCHYRLPYNKLIAREVALAYARDERLPGALAERAAAVRPPDLARGNVKLLYVLKQLQWLRLGAYKAFAGSSALNSQRVAQEFQKARRDYGLLSDEISFQREREPR